jgi:NTE family protein
MAPERENPARRSFYDGLPPEAVEELLRGTISRRYPAGSVLIAEGDNPGEIYVAQRGRAEVFMSDRDGVEHSVARLRPGATVGEMSFFTGHPATATVRAATDLEVMVVSGADFERIAARYPILYQNVGAILSHRLARADRLSVESTAGRVGVLLDEGAPPELAWALACSVAWHTRSSTQLVLVTDEEPPESLTRLAAAASTSGVRERAFLRVTSSLETTRAYSIAGQVEDAFSAFRHVLVLVRDAASARLPDAPVIHLSGAGAGASPEEQPPRMVVRAWADDGGRLGPAADGVVSIPRLADADVEALRRGILPAATPAGAALGWVARDHAGLKVGVALGAGSLKGYAHVGALEVLDRAGIVPDYLAGTSIGAAVAGMRAVGYDLPACADLLDRAGPMLFKPTLARGGLLSPRGIRRVLQELAGNRRIEQLPVELGVVAADLETKRELLFRRGLLWLAVLGSISIPGFYPAQRIGRHTVVDGGVLDPVPVRAVADMGADVVIAVRLATPAPPSTTEAEAIPASGPRPSALAVLSRALEIMYGRIAVDVPDVTTVTITPHLAEIPGVNLRHFVQGRRYIEDGEAAAEAALARITAALPWLRGREA